VDVLAWHSQARALFVVEVKSDLRDTQDTFHALDVKRRVVPRLFEAEKGLRFDCLGIVMVLADLRVERQRVERHGSTFDAGLPARTVDVRRWLQRPVGPLRASGSCRFPALWALFNNRVARDGFGGLGARRMGSRQPPKQKDERQPPFRMGSEVSGIRRPRARGHNRRQRREPALNSVRWAGILQKRSLVSVDGRLTAANGRQGLPGVRVHFHASHGNVGHEGGRTG